MNKRKLMLGLWGLALSGMLVACALGDAGIEEAATDEPEAVATQAPVTATQAATAVPAPDETLAPTTEPGEQPFDKWSLWNGGTQLRGANIYQRRVFEEIDGLEFVGPGPFGPPYTQEDFDHLRALGANYVNLSIAGLYTVEPPYRVDDQAAANLDRLLEMAANANLFAVISFRSGPGRSEFSILGAGDWYPSSYLIESVWTEPAAQAAWAAMWRFTAERYVGSQVVAGYDLMCEPNSNGIMDIWDAQEFYDEYGGSGYDWNTWYPPIVEAIRSVDADTPILVSGLSFGDIAWLPYVQLVEDERLVYTFHQYNPHEYSHQEPGAGQEYLYPGEFDADYDGEPEWVDRLWLEELFSIAVDWMGEHSRPLAVNEYGSVRWAPGAAEYLRDQMELFEQHGWNYAIWMWYPAWEPLKEGDNSFNYRLGADPHNLDDLASTDILETLIDFWSRNLAWPPE